MSATLSPPHLRLFHHPLGKGRQPLLNAGDLFPDYVEKPQPLVTLRTKHRGQGERLESLAALGGTDLRPQRHPGPERDDGVSALIVNPEDMSLAELTHRSEPKSEVETTGVVWK